MSTVEDLVSGQILNDSRRDLNMPSIQQNTKRFFGTNSKSRTGYRGTFYP